MITSQCRISADQRAVLLTQDRAKRVYIAGPMTGIEDFNFPAFNAMADNMRAGGWHVENPADHGVVHGAEWADYLRYDVGRLATCEAIMLLPGWSKSKGANLEVTIARQLGMPIMLADGAEPAPQPHPEPIAWMVGTAIWWTKEEAERDAAATGLPIVGLGPMTCAAPAEKHRGEPVAWMDPRSPQMHATISNEVKQHNVKFGGAPASAINGYTVPLYTHADPGDLERCEARLHEVASLCATVEQERDTLRAQLAEAHALLRDIELTMDAQEDSVSLGYDIEMRMATILRPSASAEPSAPVEIDERQEFESAWSARIERLRIRERGNEFYRVQPNDLYRWNNVQDAWELWQARAALERKPS